MAEHPHDPIEMGQTLRERVGSSLGPLLKRSEEKAAVLVDRAENRVRTVFAWGGSAALWGTVAAIVSIDMVLDRVFSADKPDLLRGEWVPLDLSPADIPSDPPFTTPAESASI